MNRSNENLPKSNNEQINSCLMSEQQQSLSKIDYDLSEDQKDDGSPKWFRFFENGLRDENGDLWAIYNDYPNEKDKEGWKVFRCGHDESEFEEIGILGVTKNELLPHSAYESGNQEKVTTIGLNVNEENDIINMIFAEDEPPAVIYWNQSKFMQAVPSFAQEISHNEVVLGSHKFGKEVVRHAVEVAKAA